MLSPHGYIQIGGDIRLHEEFDTITCVHCNQIVKVKPGTGSTVYLIDKLHTFPNGSYHIERKEEAGAFCRLCMRAVCLQCDSKGVCTPLMKRIEEMEDKGRMLKSLGL